MPTLSKQVKIALWKRMHQSLAEVGKWLRRVLQGYFNYHAVPGNLHSLRSFRLEVRKRWLRVIRRRSQRSGIVLHTNDGAPGNYCEPEVPLAAPPAGITGTKSAEGCSASCRIVLVAETNSRLVA